MGKTKHLRRLVSSLHPRQLQQTWSSVHQSSGTKTYDHPWLWLSWFLTRHQLWMLRACGLGLFVFATDVLLLYFISDDLEPVWSPQGQTDPMTTQSTSFLEWMGTSIWFLIEVNVLLIVLLISWTPAWCRCCCRRQRQRSYQRHYRCSPTMFQWIEAVYVVVVVTGLSSALVFWPAMYGHPDFQRILFPSVQEFSFHTESKGIMMTLVVTLQVVLPLLLMIDCLLSMPSINRRSAVLTLVLTAVGLLITYTVTSKAETMAIPGLLDFRQWWAPFSALGLTLVTILSMFTIIGIQIWRDGIISRRKTNSLPASMERRLSEIIRSSQPPKHLKRAYPRHKKPTLYISKEEKLFDRLLWHRIELLAGKKHKKTQTIDWIRESWLLTINHLFCWRLFMIVVPGLLSLYMFCEHAILEQQAPNVLGDHHHAPLWLSGELWWVLLLTVTFIGILFPPYLNTSRFSRSHQKRLTFFWTKAPSSLALYNTTILSAVIISLLFWLIVFPSPEYRMDWLWVNHGQTSMNKRHNVIRVFMSHGWLPLTVILDNFMTTSALDRKALKMTFMLWGFFLLLVVVADRIANRNSLSRLIDQDVFLIAVVGGYGILVFVLSFAVFGFQTWRDVVFLRRLRNKDLLTRLEKEL